MRKEIKQVTCDRCEAEINPSDIEVALSDLAEGVARELGWEDLCADCCNILNKVVTGESGHKLVPRKKGSECDADKDAEGDADSEPSNS